MAGNIFISYRRDDAKMTAGRLHDALARHFGKSHLFMDVDNLLAGQRFDRQLDQALTNCDVLLAVIGPSWMDIVSERVSAHEQNPDERDYVRDEIAAALKREIVVIPVLLDGAELPPKSALPPDLQDLVFHQKHDITYERFGRDVDDLASAIKAVRKARAKSARPSMLGRVAAVLTLVAIPGGGGYLAYNGQLANMIGSPPSVENNPDAKTRQAAEKAEAEEAARIAKVKAEEEKRRKAEEAQKAAAEQEAEKKRLALLEDERKRKAEEEARNRDPALSIKPSSGESFKDCDECPEMVVVPAGSFMMGSPKSEEGRDDDEGPQREVTFAKTFAVGKFEVAWDEWDVCVADGGCDNGPVEKAGGDNGWGKGRRPVINVSWNDAKAYTTWLSKNTGKAYRLLSEAEWEYAARAGTTTAYFWGDRFDGSRANNNSSSTVEVGRYGANAWGLHDMHGNVWEWTEDCWKSSYEGAPTDGSAWTAGNCSLRVLRDASWGSDPQMLRSAYRGKFQPVVRYDSLGFRIARTLTP